jgi:hypothetical protein
MNGFKCERMQKPIMNYMVTGFGNIVIIYGMPMIQETTLEAYKIIKPELGELQKVVYQTIVMNPGMSNHDIARFLHWEINRVTPRVKELRDKGIVICGGTKQDRITNKKVMMWTTP